MDRDDVLAQVLYEGLPQLPVEHAVADEPHELALMLDEIAGPGKDGDDDPSQTPRWWR